MLYDRRKNFIRFNIESQFVTNIVEIYTTDVKIFAHIILYECILMHNYT